MRRALARGRLLPQSLSTDPRLGRLSLKAVALFPLLWINCDDQGRITGDPDEIKYAVCPNVEHISRQDIPELLNELQAREFILWYSTSKSRAIQMLDWWEEQKLQWAWPSRFSPPDGWTDHLRYKAGAKEVVTENWPPLGLSGENSAESPGDGSGENPGERSQYPPLNNKEERGKRKEERGISPESSGEKMRPSTTQTASSMKKQRTKFSSSSLEANTEASKYLFSKTGRKRWQNLVQKEEFEKAEAEVGFERMKGAIDWALLKGTSNIKSIITAARREKSGEPREDRGTKERPRQERARPITYIKGTGEDPGRED